MRELLDMVEKVLDHDASLLIVGESGVGKNYLASAIHACSVRREQPFVHIDCATIPPDLFESELFGYERGTFTDARERKLGKLEVAGSGTVYFDEIAALTPNLQAKLLRAIQDRSFTRLGGHQQIRFDSRVISSSSEDLEARVADGSFRRDLFYRINVLTLRLPPLRERRGDIPLLARTFLRQAKGSAKTIHRSAMAILTKHVWPGNLRELRNVIERAAVISDGNVVTAAALPLDQFFERETLVQVAQRERWTLEELEKQYIAAVLRDTHSNYSEAARILGINRKTLLEKRRKYALDEDEE